MRLQAKKPVNLRGKILGGSEPLICIPLLAEEEEKLEREAAAAAESNPDVVEWRADYFRDSFETAKVDYALRALRDIIGEIPLIFTFRSILEGGFRKAEDPIRYDIIKRALCSGKVDAADMELACGIPAIERIRDTAAKQNVPLILSYHNFTETPPEEYLLNKIKEQISVGANVAKIAVMPRREEDILTLFSAVLKARREIDTPIIAVSMGELGMASRIAGGIFGSDLTFGAGRRPSAPGQIPVTDLRAAIKALFR